MKTLLIYIFLLTFSSSLAQKNESIPSAREMDSGDTSVIIITPSDKPLLNPFFIEGTAPAFKKLKLILIPTSTLNPGKINKSSEASRYASTQVVFVESDKDGFWKTASQKVLFAKKSAKRTLQVKVYESKSGFKSEILAEKTFFVDHSSNTELPAEPAPTKPPAAPDKEGRIFITEKIPAKKSDTQLSILKPSNNGKVRGLCTIYGKARAGSKVEVYISSQYFKTGHDNQERLSKGEGPISRMNRKFPLTTDRGGNWILREIDLTNAGWEETFTIKVTSEDGNSKTIEVYDKTHPRNID
ncbi:MAG: hypothetical protein ABIN36_11455 [Ferruginibacter sp.]